MTTLSAIPIRAPYIDMILAGAKIWEIRPRFTKKTGAVALIRSGSGTVVATAALSEVIKLSTDFAYANLNKMNIKSMPKEKAKSFDGKYAWVLKDIIKLNTPIPYKHPPGAVRLSKNLYSLLITLAVRSLTGNWSFVP